LGFESYKFSDKFFGFRDYEIEVKNLKFSKKMNSEQVREGAPALGIKNDQNTKFLVMLSIVCLAGIVFYILKCFMGSSNEDLKDYNPGDPDDREFMKKQWELYRKHKDITDPKPKDE
jgi:hypothetical protein